MDASTLVEVQLQPRHGHYPSLAGGWAASSILDTYVKAYMFEAFLYGIYFILFIICIWTLVRNKPTTRKLYLATALVMFLISTTSICISLYFLFGFLMVEKQPTFSLRLPKFFLYVLNNAISDILLISRCYAIWSRSKTVIAVPCLFLFASCTCGFVFTGASPDFLASKDRLEVYLWMNMSLNILVTLLTAARIWWTARKVTQALGCELSKKYYSAVAIIIESGALYTIYVLVDQFAPCVLFDAGLLQVVGIAPTLIIVQVGLGKHTRDLETTISFVCRDSNSSAALAVEANESQFQDPMSMASNRYPGRSPIIQHP